MQQGVPVEHECLQVHQATHLGGQTLQVVLTEVQVQQVREVDEELVGDGVNAAGGREGRGGQCHPVSATCPPPGPPWPTLCVALPSSHSRPDGHLLWLRFNTSMFLAFSSSRGHSVSWL